MQLFEIICQSIHITAFLPTLPMMTGTGTQTIITNNSLLAKFIYKIIYKSHRLIDVFINSAITVQFFKITETHAYQSFLPNFHCIKTCFDRFYICIFSVTALQKSLYGIGSLF